MESNKEGALQLDDGSSFRGFLFGNDHSVTGEVVFSTSMVGYPEALTDPSFYGQILLLSYPMIGSYGVAGDSLKEGLSTLFESERIMVSGLVVAHYSFNYSHWRAIKSLDSWLKEQQVTGLFGVDTRAVIKRLRMSGALSGRVAPLGVGSTSPIPPTLLSPSNGVVLPKGAALSCKEPLYYGSGKKRVVVVDCGVRHSILRELIGSGLEVVRVPWDFDFNQLQFDGVVISNGPGTPDHYLATIENIVRFMELEKQSDSPRPLMGICLGNLLIAKAIGAEIEKMRYGHCGANQPIKATDSSRSFITSQNHSYVVLPSTLNEEWYPSFVNLNDGTIEGISHKSKPYFGTQFYPGVEGAPSDTNFIYKQFLL